MSIFNASQAGCCCQSVFSQSVHCETNQGQRFANFPLETAEGEPWRLIWAIFFLHIGGQTMMSAARSTAIPIQTVCWITATHRDLPLSSDVSNVFAARFSRTHTLKTKRRRIIFQVVLGHQTPSVRSRSDALAISSVELCSCSLKQIHKTHHVTTVTSHCRSRHFRPSVAHKMRQRFPVFDPLACSAPPDAAACGDAGRGEPESAGASADGRQPDAGRQGWWRKSF